MNIKNKKNKSDKNNEDNKVIIYLSLSNSWNKFIDNLASFLFNDTPYYILPICIYNDLDSDYSLFIFKKLINKKIKNVDIYYPQNFYINYDIVSLLINKLNLRLLIFNYLNQIDKLINNIHPNQPDTFNDNNYLKEGHYSDINSFTNLDNLQTKKLNKTSQSKEMILQI